MREKREKRATERAEESETDVGSQDLSELQRARTPRRFTAGRRSIGEVYGRVARCEHTSLHIHIPIIHVKLSKAGCKAAVKRE